MSDVQLRISQRPDHTVQVGDTVFVDDDPFVIRKLDPVREAGVFLDWGQHVRSNEVVVTIERFDGYER